MHLSLTRECFGHKFLCNRVSGVGLELARLDGTVSVSSAPAQEVVDMAHSPWSSQVVIPTGL